VTREQARASFIKQAKEAADSLKELYRNRLKSGWTLNQIDEMDIFFYLSLYKEDKTYIDDLRLF